jgi:hypothetical protein
MSSEKSALLDVKKKELRYAVVETITGSESDHTVCKGLLRGSAKVDGSEFLSMETKEDGKSVCLMVNMSKFNLLSLEYFDGASRTYLYFRATEEDQKLAKGCLDELIDSLERFAYEENKRIIDSSKYTDVPSCVVGSKNSVSRHGSVGTSIKRLGNRENIADRSPSQAKTAEFQKGYSHSAQPNWWNDSKHGLAKKDPTAAVIRRKSRRPSKKFLEEMRKKMEMIAKREYEPSLPKIAGDDEEVEESDDLSEEESKYYGDALRC